MPLQQGIIWAKTTCRFFAVYKDQSNGCKKRFKTFDPKRYGSVAEAHSAAISFLTRVEPWQSKNHPYVK